jgi:predicted aldo/keto reductase-like oxidoreductase
LQSFFAAYGAAVRYAIAKRTRQLLKKGGDKELESDQIGKTEIYPDIPDGMLLQEYALRYLLSESAFTRLIVGASSTSDLIQNLEVFEEISKETGSPMEKCELLRKEEEIRRGEDNSQK